MPIPSVCQPIQSKLDSAKRLLNKLQKELNAAPPSEKPSIIQEIGLVRSEITSLHQTLEACIIQNGGAAPPVPRHPSFNKATRPNFLLPGEGLAIGETLTSDAGNAQFIMQGDGNAVLYFTNDNQPWATGTNGTSACCIIMQGDGNLVVYDEQGIAKWNTATDNNPGAYFVIQDDGNAVIYDVNQNPIWNSGTVLFEILNGGNAIKFSGRIPWDEDLIGGGFGANFSATVFNNGTIKYEVQVKKGGLQNYQFKINLMIKSKKAPQIVYQKKGEISGALAGRKEKKWSETIIEPEVAANFKEIMRSGSFIHAKNFKGSITSFLENTLEFAVNFFVIGPVATPFMPIIFVGTELVTLIKEGNFDSGARIINGLFWMKGPAGILFSVIAGNLASLGNKSRTITNEEYEWAKEKVFKDSLPPINHIIITDNIGLDDRAFVFPTHDGKITVNLGKNFSNPRENSESTSTFIHELAHVCQCHHWGHLNFANKATATQLGSICCTPYLYDRNIPENAKFTDYGVEQQATIVEDWFKEHKRIEEISDNTEKQRQLIDFQKTKLNEFIENYVRIGVY